MKRIFYLLFLISFVTFAVSSTSVGVEKTTALVPVLMSIYDRVTITIQRNTITWDFNRIDQNANNPPFPPAVFPEYYEPTQPRRRRYQRIRYSVRGFGGPAGNWEVTIAGAGDPAPTCGILLSDIEYGDAAAGVWSPLGTVPQVLVSGSGDIRRQQNLFQDYRVMIEGNETNTSGSTTTIIYTIQTY